MICIARKDGQCSAASPEIREINPDSIPKEIGKKTEELVSCKYYKCSYCGTVWASGHDFKSLNETSIKIGVTDLGSHEVVWLN